MPAKWARVWFGVTALCVVAGVALSVVSAVHSTGHFPTGTERGFNTFAFFTIQANLLVGATTLLLAIRLDRSSLVFGTFRLIALVAITVTGIVYHVALSGLLTLAGYHQLANQLVHTVVPVLAVSAGCWPGRVARPRPRRPGCPRSTRWPGWRSR